MKPLSHRVITASVAVLSSAPPVGIVGAVVGSTVPDMDLRLGIPHRTWTHWWPLAVFPAILFWFFPFEGILPDVRTGLFWFFVGAFLHIIEDSTTASGVPLLSPRGRRFSFRLTKTGGTLEKILVAGCLVAVLVDLWPVLSLGARRVESMVRSGDFSVVGVIHGILSGVL